MQILFSLNRSRILRVTKDSRIEWNLKSVGNPPVASPSMSGGGGRAGGGNGGGSSGANFSANSTESGLGAGIEDVADLHGALIALLSSTPKLVTEIGNDFLKAHGKTVKQACADAGYSSVKTALVELVGAEEIPKYSGEISAYCLRGGGGLGGGGNGGGSSETNISVTSIESRGGGAGVAGACIAFHRFHTACRLCH